MPTAILPSRLRCPACGHEEQHEMPTDPERNLRRRQYARADRVAGRGGAVCDKWAMFRCLKLPITGID
jgi:hypothetical protein